MTLNTNFNYDDNDDSYGDGDADADVDLMAPLRMLSPTIFSSCSATCIEARC